MSTALPVSRRALLGTASAATLGAAMGRAHAQGRPMLRIGVLTDLSGAYKDTDGTTSVACAHQAIEDFAAAGHDLPVEVLVADHQQKADVALEIARTWFDRDGVDMVTEANNTAIALAVSGLAREKNKVFLPMATSAVLTGPACSPNTIHWGFDTWEIGHSTASATVKSGGTKWYFITADYAFGKALQDDAANFLKQAGGQVLGAAAYPFPGTTDFSSFLLQAQNSGANVIAFASAGADLVNGIKQAHEFGLTRNGARLAGLLVFITDVHALGLQTAQGLLLTETFYWDLNDRTRAFTQRVLPKTPNNYPNQEHAAVYAATLHYLKAATALGLPRAGHSGLEVVEMMKRMPTDDDCFGRGEIRADGRKIHPAYLFRVKTPQESKGAWDCYSLEETIPATEAFRPIAEGHCPLVRG